MKIADQPLHLRPREKLFDRGIDALTTTELLAILLRTGYHGKSATQLAQTLLHRYPLSQLQKMSIHQLATFKGIGPSRAATIKAALTLNQLTQPTHQVTPIASPAEVYTLVQSLATKKQEHFVCLYLDARHQLLCQETITIGTISSSLVHAREIFAPALSCRASGLILVHNHPSNDTQPSREDMVATDRLVAAGELLDIPVLDHVIIGHKKWFSFKQEKLL
jgi:DNA repair protein RadC